MEKYFHVIKLREKDLRYGVSKLGNEITKGPKITWFLRKANQMKTKRCKRPFKEWEEGRGGGGSISLAWILKRLVSVFINASRRCRKLNENSLSLSEFKTRGVADAL